MKDRYQTVPKSYDPERVLSTCDDRSKRIFDGYTDKITAMANDRLAVRERPDIREHTARSLHLLDVYAVDQVSEDTRGLLLMHDIIDRAKDNTLPDLQLFWAKTAIAAHLLTDEISGRTRMFSAGVLADLIKVEDAAEGYRRYFANLPGVDPTMHDALVGRRQESLPTALWEIEEPVIALQELGMVAKTTNVESVLIKSVEMTDILMYPAKREASLLQDILETETFYAPLCEVWGFDALAMKLRSEATKQRLKMAGQYEYIEAAQQRRKYAEEIKIDEVFESLFGEEIEYEYEVDPLDDSCGESTKFSSFSVTEDESIGNVSVRYRRKSEGSIAKKLKKFGIESELMDIDAATVIATDEDHLGKVFVEMIQRVKGDDDLRLQSAPSKKEAIYVQGTEKYVVGILRKLVDAGITDFEYKILPDEPGVYQVCKFTAVITKNEGSSTMEMQFLTAAGRKAARVGETAHILYKQQQLAGRNIDYDELVKILGEIYDRKYCIDKNGETINEHSIHDAEELIAETEEFLMSLPNSDKLFRLVHNVSAPL